MTDTTKLHWQIQPFENTYQLPAPLFEILVKDWSTGLVGDYRGCVVAYVPGGYANDLDTAYAAAENAALIAKAPEMAAEIDALRKENAILHAKNAAQSDMLKGAALAAAEVTRERDALRKAVDDLTAEKTALTEMIRGMMEANAEAVESGLGADDHKPLEQGTKVRVKYGATDFMGEISDYDPIEDEYYVTTATGGRWAMSDTVTAVTETDHA